MFNLKTDYLTKLYGLSSKVDGIDITFEDKKLEEDYRKHFFQMELTKSKIFCIASISILTSSLLGNLFKNHIFNLSDMETIEQYFFSFYFITSILEYFFDGNQFI